MLYQIATIYESMQLPEEAIKYYNVLISRAPTDPSILARLGQLFSSIEDDSQALHYYNESYKFYPANLDVISWLGLWYVRSEMYDEAIKYFTKATEVQPDEVKWKLMVASCYRRLGDLKKSFSLYKNINKQFPDNIECLRYLVQLCKDLGEDSDVYSSKYAALERSTRPKGQTTFAQTNRVQQEDKSQVKRPPPSRLPPPASNNITSAPVVTRLGNQQNIVNHGII